MFSVANVILSVLQRLYFGDLISSLGFTSYNEIRDGFASDGNIVLQTQDGKFRSIGTFSAPMVLGEFLLFSGLYFSIRIKSILLRLTWFSICAVGVYCTAYKTTLMYLPAVFLMTILPFRYVRPCVTLYCILLFVFGFFSTQTYVIYDLVKDSSPVYAEYSVRLRVEFVFSVYKQMESFLQLIFG